MRCGVVLGLCVSCAAPYDSPRVDPSRVFGHAAHACATRYVPTDAATIDLTLVVGDESQRDFAIEAMCVRLDDGAVMLTDSLEIGPARVATRRVRVTPGAHTLAILASWRGKEYPGYRFEVTTKHEIDAQKSMTVRATAWETRRDVPMPERLRIDWRDE